MCHFLTEFGSSHPEAALTIGGVRPGLFDLLMQVPAFKRRKLTADNHCDILWLSPGRRRQAEVAAAAVNLADGATISALDGSRAKFLAETWTHGLVPEMVVPMIREQLDQGLGLGVFVQGKLVSWAIIMR